MSSVSSGSRARTPKKKKRKENAERIGSAQSVSGSNGDQVSLGSEDPVMVPVVAMTPPSGPLQGSPRVVKDHCADWHNYVDKWDSLSDKGLAVINKIVTAKLQTQYTDSPTVASMGDKGTETDSRGVREIKVSEELQSLCTDLGSVVQSLEKLVRKMAAITKHLRGVCNMERQLWGSQEERPLFKTWPVHFFWETSARLQEMYSLELKLRRAIAEDVAHAESRDVLMTYTSSWLHQPYTDEDEAMLLVESMLQETGFR